MSDDRFIPLALDLGPEADPVEAAVPEWLGAASALQRKRALRGLHPTGRPLSDADATCADCVACVVQSGSARRYTKCYRDRADWTRGPGSDIRQRWPACDAFRRRAEGPVPECLCSSRRVSPHCREHGEAAQ